MYSVFTIAFKITLLSFEKGVANMFNDFFLNIVSNLLIIQLKMLFTNMKIIQVSLQLKIICCSIYEYPIQLG